MDYQKIESQSPEALATARKHVRGELWGMAIGLPLWIAFCLYRSDEMPAIWTFLNIGMSFGAGVVIGALLITERWMTYLLQRAAATSEATRAAGPTNGQPPA